MSQYTFKTRYLRIAPRKVRSVADLVRGMNVNEAEAQLLMNRRRASQPILKLLRSGMAGVTEQKGDTSRLVIKSIQVDQGPMLKRYMPRARGAASLIQKKSSHITMTLVESETPIDQKFKIEIPEKKEKEQTKRSSAKVSKRPGDEKGETRSERKKRGFFKRTFGRRSGAGE